MTRIEQFYHDHPMPENILGKRFLAVGSGETYNAAVVLGEHLLREYAKQCCGNEPDEAELLETWEQLCDEDWWTQDTDLGWVWWSQDLGETDKIQFLLITEGV